MRTVQALANIFPISEMLPDDKGKNEDSLFKI